ncbi:hypothetical protein [Flavobacterium sp.]
MKKIKTLLIALILGTNAITAQVAPTTGEKQLEVKEDHPGEYLQTVKTEGLSDVVIKAMKDRLPKKLQQYGFTDITILEVGQVPVPMGWASKMGKLTSNKSKGQAMLTNAKSYSEIKRAVDKMYEPEDNDGVDWKFQVNFTDNLTGKLFKVRINMMTYKPQYIIKESDLVKDMAKD